MTAPEDPKPLGPSNQRDESVLAQGKIRDCRLTNCGGIYNKLRVASAVRPFEVVAGGDKSNVGKRPRSATKPHLPQPRLAIWHVEEHHRQ